MQAVVFFFGFVAGFVCSAILLLSIWKWVSRQCDFAKRELQSAIDKHAEVEGLIKDISRTARKYAEEKGISSK